jgi:hypothetical protein
MRPSSGGTCDRGIGASYRTIRVMPQLDVADDPQVSG